jgi:hypothetical protein
MHVRGDRSGEALLASTSPLLNSAREIKLKFSKRVVRAPLLKGVRNAQDYYVAPADHWTSGAFQYDEALSPPAGH